MSTLSEIYSQLEDDPRRTAFSKDIEAVHAQVLKADADERQIQRQVNVWLSEHQPCLFGKVAAKSGLLRYCVLTEQLLTSSDARIRDAIQAAREEWWAAAYDGLASGFVILAVSSRLALARPGQTLARFAQKLCQLYLIEKVIGFDAICTDTVFLEKPGHARRTWKWQVGVNFFGAQGDQRWWHDHRIPGGVAFSMNSVGHMAKSGLINSAMKELDTRLGEDAEDWANSHVDSLEKALLLAMRTIRRASEGPKPGTRLFRDEERNPALPCPVALPPDLRGRNHCEYFGNYHTDFTLPSEYFSDDFDFPSTHETFDNLDFTYLFDKSLDDYITMGEGQRIRTEGLEASDEERALKRERVSGVDVSLDEEPRLAALLGREGR